MNTKIIFDISKYGETENAIVQLQKILTEFFENKDFTGKMSFNIKKSGRLELIFDLNETYIVKKKE